MTALLGSIFLVAILIFASYAYSLLFSEHVVKDCDFVLLFHCVSRCE